MVCTHCRDSFPTPGTSKKREFRNETLVFCFMSKNRRSTPEDKNEGAEVKTANKFVFSLTWNQISHTQQCKLTFIVFVKSKFCTKFVLLKDFWTKTL